MGLWAERVSWLTACVCPFPSGHNPLQPPPSWDAWFQDPSLPLVRPHLHWAERVRLHGEACSGRTSHFFHTTSFLHVQVVDLGCGAGRFLLALAAAQEGLLPGPLGDHTSPGAAATAASTHGAAPQGQQGQVARQPHKCQQQGHGPQAQAGAQEQLQGMAHGPPAELLAAPTRCNFLGVDVREAVSSWRGLWD